MKRNNGKNNRNFYGNDRKGRRGANTQQKQITILFCSVIAVILMCSVFFGSIITQAAPQKNTYKYYTSIQIKSGDTLWDIAGRYMTKEYENRNEYMREVCSINHISGEKIHAGQFLVIPYYSEESED